MGKVIMLNRVSIDGFFAGPNGEIDWFIRDPEVDKAVRGNGGTGAALFGRVTYQMFESYWPGVAADPGAPKEARTVAEELGRMTKLVFSRTLTEAVWENTKLLRGEPAGEVRKLKQAGSPDYIIFGSGTIVQQLTAEGLIDEYLLVVTPVLLGTGKLLFSGTGKHNFRLADARGFSSGNVLLHYVIDR